jgi:hypothetical protein
MLALVDSDKDSQQLRQPIVLHTANRVVESMENNQIADDWLRDRIDLVLSYLPMLLVDKDEEGQPVVEHSLVVPLLLDCSLPIFVDVVEKPLQLPRQLTEKGKETIK